MADTKMTKRQSQLILQSLELQRKSVERAQRAEALKGRQALVEALQLEINDIDGTIAVIKMTA